MSDLPDNPITVQQDKEAKLKPVSEMLEEIKRKQQAPPTRSKWNVQKEERKEPVIDILEDTTNTEERQTHFPVKDEISEYTMAEVETRQKSV